MLTCADYLERDCRTVKIHSISVKVSILQFVRLYNFAFDTIEPIEPGDRKQDTVSWPTEIKRK